MLLEEEEDILSIVEDMSLDDLMKVAISDLISYMEAMPKEDWITGLTYTPYGKYLESISND